MLDLFGLVKVKRPSPLAVIFVVLLLCGVYLWYLLGFPANSNLSGNIDLLVYRFTIGLPFIAIGAFFYLKPSLELLFKPSLITMLLLSLIFFMGFDLLLRALGVEGREFPVFHSLYLCVRIALVFWIFGIRRYEISHNSFLLILAGYFLISITLDFFGVIHAFQTLDFYTGYINWLSARYAGLSLNTNMFAGLLLTIVTIHVLVNCRAQWKNTSAILLTVFIVVLAVGTKGRYGLLICALMTLLWFDLLCKKSWTKYFNWIMVFFIFLFIVASIRISVFPLSLEPPFINTNPSFYRLAHEPNLKMVLFAKGIGLTDFEQKQKFPQFEDQGLKKEIVSQINATAQADQLQRSHVASHSIFLSLPLDYGGGALLVFLLLNGVVLIRYTSVFGLSIETQVVFLTFARYFHQQMSIASWVLLVFEVAFLLHAEKREKSI